VEDQDFFATMLPALVPLYAPAAQLYLELMEAAAANRTTDAQKVGR
jgi:hypothetical protein